MKKTKPKTSPRPPSQIVKAAGTYLVLGILAIILGQAFYDEGNALRFAAELTRSRYADDGSGQITTGLVLSLVGLIWLLVGIARLAAQVDHLYRLTLPAPTEPQTPQPVDAPAHRPEQTDPWAIPPQQSEQTDPWSPPAPPVTDTDPSAGPNSGPDGPGPRY